MSNSANNEYRTVSSARGMILLVCSLLCMFIALSSVVLAEDSDIDRAKSIIAMIQKPDSPDRNRVDDVLAQIPLQFCPQRTVVPHPAAAPIDLGGLKDEAAAFAEAYDLLHGVLGIVGRCGHGMLGVLEKGKAATNAGPVRVCKRVAGGKIPQLAPPRTAPGAGAREKESRRRR